MSTPAEIVDKLNREIIAALSDPRITARLAEAGSMVLGGTPADFAKVIADETEKFAPSRTALRRSTDVLRSARRRAMEIFAPREHPIPQELHLLRLNIGQSSRVTSRAERTVLGKCLDGCGPSPVRNLVAIPLSTCVAFIPGSLSSSYFPDVVSAQRGGGGMRGGGGGWLPGGGMGGGLGGISAAASFSDLRFICTAIICNTFSLDF